MLVLLKDKGKQLLARAGVAIIDLWISTLTLRTRHQEGVRHYLRTGRFIAASWHGRLILFFLVCRGFPTAVMTSRSKDGEIAALLQSSGGYVPFRGSSSRGGKDALIRMIRYMRQTGSPASLSVDGPTGPRYRAKLGIVVLASKTGFPIIPVSFSGNRLIRFRSWDRAVLPKPFSKGVIIFGQPIHVPEKASLPELEKYRLLVEQELNRITGEVEPDFCPYP